MFVFFSSTSVADIFAAQSHGPMGFFVFRGASVPDLQGAGGVLRRRQITVVITMHVYIIYI
jgi:hypothetical protein